MVETISAEVVVPFEGQSYRLVFDWGAIEFFESQMPMSFGEFVIQLMLAEIGGAAMPKLTHLATFVRAGLARHHADVEPEQAFRMWNDAAVRAAVTGAADKALPSGEAAGAAGKRSTRTRPAARSPRRGVKRANG